MKIFTDLEVKEKLAEALNLAKTEEVLIKTHQGELFLISPKIVNKSPFDIKGIKTKATTFDILSVINESRENM